MNRKPYLSPRVCHVAGNHLCDIIPINFTSGPGDVGGKYGDFDETDEDELIDEHFEEETQPPFDIRDYIKLRNLWE